MEEVYHEKALDYLKSLQRLGSEEFLTTHPHPVLLENYRAPSSKGKLGMVNTISEVNGKTINSPAGSREEKGLLQTRVIPVEKRERSSPERMLFVGRSPNNDIVLLNKMVSKLHAYFCQVPGSKVVQLVDMNSTNGTFVNGARLSPSVKKNLDDADVISFGPETTLEYYSPEGFCQLLQQLGK